MPAWACGNPVGRTSEWRRSSFREPVELIGWRRDLWEFYAAAWVGLMRWPRLARRMRRRQMLGVLLLFLFMPNNAPIWDALIGGGARDVPLFLVCLTSFGFLTGLLMLFYPTRSIPLSGAATADDSEE